VPPRLLIFAVAALAALSLGPGRALASGGSYVFDGGTGAERAQVRAALNASAFDWSLVPATIVVHIRRGNDSDAAPGHIWLDADLLDSGTFAWGTVQHEYGHEVDYFLLNDAERTTLAGVLGAQDWFAGLAHSARGCERFASTLAWAYWPSPLNSMRPAGPGDESAALPPASFRALLARIVGMPDPFARTLAARLSRAVRG
jgi:hypothetical protein